MSEQCARCGVEIRDGGRVYALCSGEFVDGEFVPDPVMETEAAGHLCQECYEGMAG